MPSISMSREPSYKAMRAAMAIPRTPMTGSTRPAPEVGTGDTAGVVVVMVEDVLEEDEVIVPFAVGV
jgi:hypothetical protein